MRSFLKSRWSWVLIVSFLISVPVVQAGAGHHARIVVTVITASNEGTDFNLDNDVHRDQLFELFSYSSYNQQDQFVFELEKAVRNKVTLIDGYELVVTLQVQEENRVLIEALIRKGDQQFVNTVLSILHQGVAFVGGPRTSEGELILVIESS